MTVYEGIQGPCGREGPPKRSLDGAPSGVKVEARPGHPPVFPGFFSSIPFLLVVFGHRPTFVGLFSFWTRPMLTEDRPHLEDVASGYWTLSVKESSGLVKYSAPFLRALA